MKTALVLSGGGARGAYQVGVWKALEELNIKCDIVVGSSVGSINGALYTQGDFNKAYNLWKKLSIEDVFEEKIEFKNQKDLIKKYLKKALKGGLEAKGLKDKLSDVLDLDTFYNSNIDYGLTVTSYPKLKPIKITKENILKEQLVDYIVASSTVFPVFKLKEINNNKYVDGGFKVPVPFELAKKMGANKYIVVNTSSIAPNYKLPVSEDIIYIKPNNKVGFPLIFDSKKANINLRYGYNDTMKVFKKLYGKKYTFKNLDKYYIKSATFKTLNSFIDTLEYLGKTYNIDDSKIYTFNAFNKHLVKGIEKGVKIKHRKSKAEKERQKKAKYYIKEFLSKE